jgi:hypothetical protein
LVLGLAVGVDSTDDLTPTGILVMRLPSRDFMRQRAGRTQPGRQESGARVDSTGTEVGSTTTGANGTYSLSVVNAATANVRVEFSIPAAATYLQPGAHGPNNATSVQFVALGPQVSTRPSPTRPTTARATPIW